MKMVKGVAIAPPLVLLVHGWGFGPGVWQPVLRFLPDWDCCVLDLGFFGQAEQQIPAGRPLLAVGHSLGFLWLLQQLEQAPWQEQCYGLLSISGFSRFSRCGDFPHGIAPRVVQRMMRRLPQQAREVLAAFQRQSGWHGNPGQTAIDDTVALLQGLRWLQQWDGRAALASWHRPYSALAAMDDRIVPPELTAACFAVDRLQWLEKGGHILPLTQAHACAQAIQALGKMA